MNIRQKNGQKLVTNPHPKIARPPTRLLKASTFSAAKLRSANSLLKKSPMIAATGNALRIMLVCVAEKCSAGK